MEKFSKWRDASTGIQPFLPPKPPATQEVGKQILIALKYYVFGPLFAFVRLTLGLVVTFWLLLMTAIVFLLPVPSIRWFFRRYTSALGCRVLLLLLGFWWIPTEWATLRKGRNVQASETQGVPGSHVTSGDLLVANHSSYIDIIYLAFRYAPQFSQIVQIKTNDKIEYKVVELSIFGALFSVFQSPTLAVSPNQPVYSLEELQAKAEKEWKGPVVLFPEATTSNNRTILSFVPILQNYNPTRAVQIIAFRYVYDDYSPTYTAGSPFGHLFLLCCQLYNVLEVRYLPIEEAPKAVAVSQTEDYGSQVSTLLGQLLHFRRARLGAEDKVAFLQYYATANNIKSSKHD